MRGRTLLQLLLLGGSLWTTPLGAADDLAARFAQPPDCVKPWCYWWWLDGNASPTGITKDLEEMKRQGISGALLFDAGEGGPDAPHGPLFMSPAWRELFGHALREADRLGIEVGVNLCSGWNSGGTWITPEHAAKVLVWSETRVSGPGTIDRVLPPPAVRDNFYRDVGVVAIPSAGDPPRPAAPVRLTASSTYQQYRPELAADGNLETRWISNGDRPGKGPRPGRPEWLMLEYARPLAATALCLKPYTDCGPRDCEWECSLDGKTFWKLAAFTVSPRQAKTVEVGQATARFFRLVIKSAYPLDGFGESWNVQISEVAVLQRGERAAWDASLAHWELKAGRKWNGLPGQLYEEYPGTAGTCACLRGQVQDITRHMDTSGRLLWKAPAGTWTVLRFGYTLLGDKTKCTSPGTQGYEIDFMSAAAMDRQWAETGAKMVADAGPRAGKTWKYVHDDSYEVQGPDGLQQNWTPRFRDEFRRRRGYDPWPYLPVLAGRIVDSREVSDRFLWDIRRTIGDLFADHHYRRMRQLAQRHALGTHPESGGPFYPAIDALECEGINDIPMGEFWYPANVTADYSTKQAACAAHTYGKPFCQAEAFTDMGPNWEEDPYLLKICGDRAFCRGLGRAVLCFYVHQPRLDIRPGYQWEAAGTHFDRNVTWWPQIHAWLDYLSRCQLLLRHGRFAADVCYFSGEDVPNFVFDRARMRPPLAAGYDYDVCNAEVLLERMGARDRRLVLPDGMSYRLLVLPEWRAMSPRVLKKIKELVEAGATVVGPKPERAPGLTGYPRCDAEVRQLAAELWGKLDGQNRRARQVGRGRVIWGMPLAEILADDGVPPDFEVRAEAGRRKAEDALSLDYIHRTSPLADIYFVPNQSDNWLRADCVFRVAGRRPEIWDPVTGEHWEATDWRGDAPPSEGRGMVSLGRTILPLVFAPRQSWFVVFRKPAEPRTIALQHERGRPQGTVPFQGERGLFPSPKTRPNFPVLTAAAGLSGPWTVRFDPKWAGPASVVFEKLQDWTQRAEPGIRYYSGKATYEKTFDLPASFPATGAPSGDCPLSGRKGTVPFGRGRARIFLDLGRVKNLAEVRLNGKDLGVVWTAPWRVDITAAVRPAGNRLEVDVVNLWPNRLIGDATLAPPRRLTVTNVKKFKKDSPLLESGLLGPVTLQAMNP
jgi:hypothetical protein